MCSGNEVRGKNTVSDNGKTGTTRGPSKLLSTFVMVRNQYNPWRRLAGEAAVSDAVGPVGFGAEAASAVLLVLLVVALEPDGLAVALEGQHVRGDAIEEPAIVADDDDAAGVVQQRIFQRTERVDVEVVGRLVEQQDVGFDFTDESSNSANLVLVNISISSPVDGDYELVLVDIETDYPKNHIPITVTNGYGFFDIVPEIYKIYKIQSFSSPPNTEITQISCTKNNIVLDEPLIDLKTFTNNIDCTVLYDVVFQDIDGDGFTEDIDCNDNDPTIYPGAVEIADDDIDQDCDGFDLIVNPDYTDDNPTDSNGGGSSGDTTPPIFDVKKKSGGGCSGDCTPPTFGKNKQYKQVVQNGFSFNDIAVDVTAYHTEYPLITVETNSTNNLTLTAYENKGPNNIKWVQVGLGMPEIGAPLSEAQTLVTIYLNGGQVEKIEKVEKYPLVDVTNITTSIVECGYTTSNCLQISMDYIYRDQPKYNVMAINVMDNPPGRMHLRQFVALDSPTRLVPES